MSQASLFETPPAEVPARRPAATPGKADKASRHAAGGVNLNTLDVRIYGMQRPVNMSGCNHIFDDMTDEQEAAWRLKNLPFKFVYTDEDFTPEAKVGMLRRRGWAYMDIFREFPDLADAAARLAVDERKAIA